MKHLVVTEEIWKEGNMYTAYCPELDVISCGRDIDEARKNLLEVIEIQLEETIKLGTLETFLEDAGYDLNTSQFSGSPNLFGIAHFSRTSSGFRTHISELRKQGS